MRSREYREGGKTLTLSITYIKKSFLSKFFLASIAQSAERQSWDPSVPGSNPGSVKKFFLMFLLLLYVKMAVLYENVINFILFETLKVTYH